MMVNSPRTALIVLVTLVGVIWLVFIQSTKTGSLEAEMGTASGIRATGTDGVHGSTSERDRVAELHVLNETLVNLRNELKSLAASQSQMHSVHHEMNSKSTSMMKELTADSSSLRHTVESGTTHGRREKSSPSQPRSRDRKSILGGTLIESPGVAELIHAPSRLEAIKEPIIQNLDGDSKYTDTAKLMKEKKKKKAVLFTMDSITSYEENSRNGGAAGEILIRKSLEGAFQHFGVDLRVIRSDREFETVRGSEYDIIIVDPWTWAARGWVPKPPLRGQDSKIYILDFFGSPKLRGTGLHVPPTRFLTAFGSAWNTFLGYYVEEPAAAATATAPTTKKLQQGVIWGKDPRHFEGKTAMLQAVLRALPEVTLVSTCTKQLFQHPRMQWKGHQTPQSWRALLLESKFLVGLGDPLLGPSAIDAVSAGCVYINPQYGKPKKDRTNQHPYAAEHIGSPYVCNYRLGNSAALQECASQALRADLAPHPVLEFQKAAHFKRVAEIFDL